MVALRRMLRAARIIYETEGLRELLRRACRFLLSRVFEYSTYYVYARPVEDSAEADEALLSSKVEGLSLKLVCSNAEADGLEAQGFEFRSYVPDARERLDAGAPATCVFVGKELGHIGWVALDQRALDTMSEPPYRVNFANGEAVGTGAWTNPKHRGKRLRGYGAAMSRCVMRENGCALRRYAVRKSNVPLMKPSAIVDNPSGEGRFLRVLWWKSWKEWSLPRDGVHGS